MPLSGSEKMLADKVAIGRVLTTKVLLTNAQIKALRATPVTLVPAVANKTLRFLGARLKLIYGGTNVFTESTANLAVKFTDGSGVAVSSTIESTGFIDQSANTLTNAIPVIDAIVVETGAKGKALVLHNIGAGEIAGNAGADNRLLVSVSYIVEDLN
jgi:uncharacterized protein YijF (DUF1287 family)